MTACRHATLSQVPMFFPWLCRQCGEAFQELTPVVMITDPAHPDYYRQGKPPPPAWPAQDPPPEVLSVQDRPLEAPGVPRAVSMLQRAAQGAGWVALVGYARSPERAVRVGTYKITESYGLYTDLAHGVRLSAVYARTSPGGAWAWRNTAIWPIRVPGLGSRFTHATVKDLQEFVAVRGSVMPAWFKGIHAREEDKKLKARLKSQQASRNSKPKEGAS
jgi:hypothetical protein